MIAKTTKQKKARKNAGKERKGMVRNKKREGRGRGMTTIPRRGKDMTGKGTGLGTADKKDRLIEEKREGQRP